MKKTYIIPESLIVVLGTLRMMAESDTLPLNDDDETDDPNEWYTKQQNSVWDNEW